MSALVPVEIIAKKIYLIRGEKVMLDRDLAELYGVETRVLNQAVRRNIKRFPEDFMLSLSRSEIMNLSQIVISSKIKHAPNVFAFTEQGVAMLSGVLNSGKAISVNIAIMRAFVKVREYLATHKDVLKKLVEHDTQIKSIVRTINKLLLPPPVKKTGKMGF
ncbi:MAG: ORF6N domain-containing protein [Elusimicrobiota bacterium]|nr:ORF6N domain-containing protein [Elusimicrobiota bacterium]